MIEYLYLFNDIIDNENEHNIIYIIDFKPYWDFFLLSFVLMQIARMKGYINPIFQIHPIVQY